MTIPEIPAFMSWPLPTADMREPDRAHNETEAHIWQAGRCAICDRDEASGARRLSLDHDHETGLVRGLLCTRCNLQEGRQKRPVFRLWRAGMNPCAIFGWYYLHRGAYGVMHVTPERAMKHAAYMREQMRIAREWDELTEEEQDARTDAELARFDHILEAAIESVRLARTP